MIYRSNLSCPDLTPYFRHTWSRPQPQSFGHQVLSDWAEQPDYYFHECGFMTHDEAAILYNCARQFDKGHGWWLDIGTHTGWTVAHVAEAGMNVIGIDPELKYQNFLERFEENTAPWKDKIAQLHHVGSDQYFADPNSVPIDGMRVDGVTIDGEHGWGYPLRDAQNAARALSSKRGVILFHDFIGGPVQEGVVWLMDNGFHARVYFTPFMVACCWRGDFVPPVHQPDPNLPDLVARCPGFPWNRLS